MTLALILVMRTLQVHYFARPVTVITSDLFYTLIPLYLTHGLHKETFWIACHGLCISRPMYAQSLLTADGKSQAFLSILGERNGRYFRSAHFRFAIVSRHCVTTTAKLTKRLFHRSVGPSTVTASKQEAMKWTTLVFGTRQLVWNSLAYCLNHDLVNWFNVRVKIIIWTALVSLDKQIIIKY